MAGLSIIQLFFWIESIILVNQNVFSQGVNIEAGEIIGNVNSVDIDGESYNVHEYLGIPYAKPPIGDLRFRKPEKNKAFESPLNATKYGAACPQIVSGVLSDAAWNQSEDCLTINVFVPAGQPDNSTGHAVMVWIFGGRFVEGSAITYDGNYLAAYGNVIVVTFNYRLSIFGFLSTDDDNARGNFGLWDQRMALRWVQDNIGHLSGDKSRVTLFGFSAGATSCLAHGLVPQSAGLFQKIIAESGAITLTGTVSRRKGLPDARIIAKELECDTQITYEMLDCLRNKPWNDIMEAVVRSFPFRNVFSPKVDDELFNRDPSTLLELSKTVQTEEVEFFRSLDFLSGVNMYEGTMLLSFMFNATQLEYFQLHKNMKANFLKQMLQIGLRKTFSDDIVKMVDAEYTQWSNPEDTDGIRLQIVKMLGDMTFGIPTMEMAHLHTTTDAKAQDYVYVFDSNHRCTFFPLQHGLTAQTTQMKFYMCLA